MEILLFEQSYKTKIWTSGETLFKIELQNQQLERIFEENSPHEEYRQKVVAASTQYSKINNGRSVCIHVKKNPANPDFSKCTVRMHGFLQDNLSSLWAVGLKVRVHARCDGLYDNLREWEYYPAHFCADIPIEKPASSSPAASIDPGKEDCIKNVLFSEVKDVPILAQNWKHALNTFHSTEGTFVYGFVKVSLISDCNNLVNSVNDQLAVVNNEEPGLARICKRILDSKLNFDVTLVAQDGTGFDCNKAFLAAQSDVLAVMLETDMKEAKTNQVKMKDMNAVGVKALLEYIYTLDLDLAFENCDVALELLQAGQKYNIKSLEKQVSSIVLKKDVEWFSVDMAFSLFLFARKEDSMEDIKLKAVSVLKSKSKEFMECKTYKKLFQENPAQSSEAVQELFCLCQSQCKY